MATLFGTATRKKMTQKRFFPAPGGEKKRAAIPRISVADANLFKARLTSPVLSFHCSRFMMMVVAARRIPTPTGDRYETILNEEYLL